MFSLIGSAIIGLIAGTVAKFIHPGDEKIGWLWTMLLGLGGSFTASFLGRMLGLYKEGDSAGFIMSVLGAVLLLFIYDRIGRNKLK